MSAMIAIADDPIIACLLRTGLPPWEEEDPDEHDDYYRNFFEPPMAIYEGESYDYF